MHDTRSKEMTVRQTPSKGESEMHTCTSAEGKEEPPKQDDRFGLCPLCSKKGRFLTDTCDCGTDLCWMICPDCQTKWVIDDRTDTWAEMRNETISLLGPFTQVMPFYQEVPRRDIPDDSYSLLVAVRHMFRTVALIEKNGHPTAKFLEQYGSLLDCWLEEAPAREQKKRTIKSGQEAKEVLRRLIKWIEGDCPDPSDDDLPF